MSLTELDSRAKVFPLRRKVARFIGIALTLSYACKKALFFGKRAFLFLWCVMVRQLHNEQVCDNTCRNTVN